MPPESAKCAWEVTAGIIPGQVDRQHSKSWWITSAEWEASDGGLVLMLEREAQAMAYARYLQILCANGREVNWTRVDFVWF